MCDCESNIKAKFQEFYPNAEYIHGQYEMLSSRAYMEMEIKLPDKKKPITRLLMHSYCPTCGVKYEDPK